MRPRGPGSCRDAEEERNLCSETGSGCRMRAQEGKITNSQTSNRGHCSRTVGEETAGKQGETGPRTRAGTGGAGVLWSGHQQAPARAPGEGSEATSLFILVQHTPGTMSSLQSPLSGKLAVTSHSRLGEGEDKLTKILIQLWPWGSPSPLQAASFLLRLSVPSPPCRYEARLELPASSPGSLGPQVTDNHEGSEVSLPVCAGVKPPHVHSTCGWQDSRTAGPESKDLVIHSTAGGMSFTGTPGLVGSSEQIRWTLGTAGLCCCK